MQEKTENLIVQFYYSIDAKILNHILLMQMSKEFLDIHETFVHCP